MDRYIDAMKINRVEEKYTIGECMAAFNVLCDQFPDEDFVKITTLFKDKDNRPANSTPKEKQQKKQKDEAGPAESSQKEKQHKKKKEEDSDESPPKAKGRKGGGFLAPLQLSDALIKFIGTGESALSRSDVVKRVWNYIKENKLQV
ncbi:uncharacterized protein LOC120254659 [Dioscorea cayenensis subsp. rotundata]|uniref:Uncharacterized protein LOC120254659 n=1 Tax=Dioscorea cayennensis subsp. rotundata TaxID=55577 RepID=A0AB40AUJ7_DIOCR|nr:uncharacterized protein LOC120254659 [Dioscorea cayenensis subsp. rotundata]